jgi:RimJ/RimL family protein N-acetyltransferase
VAFPDTFTTARLHAERLTVSHWAELHRMHQDPVAMAYLGGVRDAAWTSAYLERNLEHWERHGFGLWILRELPPGAPVGRAVLRHLLVDDTDEVELGYGFYQPYWGRGLATEITRACLRFGCDVLRLSSLVAVTSPSNHASQHVLTKCGLAFDRLVTMEGSPQWLFRTRVLAARDPRPSTSARES